MLDLQAGYSLVQYDALHVSEEETSEQLKEWFVLPVAGPPVDPDAQLPGSYPRNLDPGYVMRPAPPQQVRGTQTLHGVGWV